MKKSILKAIEDKYKLSGGNNGIYITTLKLTFNIAQIIFISFIKDPCFSKML